MLQWWISKLQDDPKQLKVVFTHLSIILSLLDTND